MKFIFLFLFSILSTNIIFCQNHIWKDKKVKNRAYTFPIGTTKRITNNTCEYKIKLPVSEKDSKINIFLNKHNNQDTKYCSNQVECLNYSKGESRFFSIMADTTNSVTKILLHTPVSMGKFQIEENENLKFIFIDSDNRKTNKIETIVILYLDNNQDEIENKLKQKGIINQKYIGKDINTIYKYLKPSYTITYKEVES